MEPVARDLIQRAHRLVGKENRVDECRTLLAEAEKLVDSGDEWIAIAEVWAELGDAEAARRYIALGLAAPRDHDTFTHAAWVLRHTLGDPDEARVVLDRCAIYLRTAKRPDWVGLVRAYMELDDRAMARSTLESATEHVEQRVYELLRIARAYVEHLGDHESARALLVRAEAEATADDWHWLADAHRDLFRDADRARAILDAALDHTGDVRTCLALAHAMRSEHGEHAALAKAEAMATTADQWLAIAEHYYDRQPRELAELRRCLQRALDADVDGHERVRIAHAYRHRVNDPATAAAIAPAGLTPASIVVKRHTLEGWTSEPARLLEWVRPQLDANALDRLSERGGSGRDKNLAVIGDIQRTGLVPYPLGWHPREAFEWERWTKGTEVNPLRRAFACSVLLIADAGPECRDAFEATVAVLVESCRELGEEALAGATGLLVALAESMDPELPSFAFALLGVLLAAAARDPQDSRLPALCDRLITIVPNYNRVFTRYTNEWLLGLTNFDSGHKQFRKLIASILGTDPSHPHLVEIAKLVADRRRPRLGPASAQ